MGDVSESLFRTATSWSTIALCTTGSFLASCYCIPSTAEGNGTSLKQWTLMQSLHFSVQLLETFNQIKFWGRSLINKSRIRSSKTCVMAYFILANVIESYLHEREQKRQPLDACVCVKKSSKSFVCLKYTFISFFFFYNFCPPDGLLWWHTPVQRQLLPIATYGNSHVA